MKNITIISTLMFPKRKEFKKKKMESRIDWILSYLIPKETKLPEWDNIGTLSSHPFAPKWWKRSLLWDSQWQCYIFAYYTLVETALEPCYCLSFTVWCTWYAHQMVHIICIILKSFLLIAVVYVLIFPGQTIQPPWMFLTESYAYMGKSLPLLPLLNHALPQTQWVQNWCRSSF